jgi:hypothetical protein
MRGTWIEPGGLKLLWKLRAAAPRRTQAFVID